MIFSGRLHPLAVALAGIRMLREAALPLVAIAVVSASGGGFEWADTLRALPYAVIGALLAAMTGLVSWLTTSLTITEHAVELRSGWLSKSETTIPIERVQGVDELAGPLHRLFGVVRVDVQTAGGKSGGEISLAAVGPEVVAALRQVVRNEAAPEPASGAVRRLGRGSLLVAALTAGRLGVLLPVVAFLPQLFDELVFGDDPDRADTSAIAGLAPDSANEWVLVAAIVLAAAWLLSALGVVIAFAGFELERREDRLLIRRGFLQRRAATVPVARVQALRVVEGVLRQPFGLASVRVEVAGYAREEAAAQTIFPLLRVSQVDALVAEMLPELPHALGPLRPVPRRALRRYLPAPALAGAPAGWLAAIVAGTSVPLAFVGAGVLLGILLGVLRHRAAAWRVEGEAVALRFRRLARTTLTGPLRLTQEHSVSQSPLQRRAGLADFRIVLGVSGRGRVRHLEATDAWAIWRQA